MLTFSPCLHNALQLPLKKFEKDIFLSITASVLFSLSICMCSDLYYTVQGEVKCLNAEFPVSHLTTPNESKVSPFLEPIPKIYVFLYWSMSVTVLSPKNNDRLGYQKRVKVFFVHFSLSFMYKITIYFMITIYRE